MLDLLYGQAVRVRRRWFERHPGARRQLRSPVVSIGNLTLGGSGKTPLVRAVADWLLARGERPAILSRGYGRVDRPDGVVIVADGTRLLADLARSGDEPMMLARAVPGAIIAVCEDRHLAGVAAERRLGATVHVLDDGFQHLTLERDLDVLVTGVGDVGGGRVLPFGRLREPADAASRADVLVVMGADAAAARSEAWTLGVSQSLGARRVVAPPPAGLAAPVIAVAGIAHPGQFLESLRVAGWPVARLLPFPDHHQYGERDVAAIAAASRDAGADAVVTTEKDIVRLEALGPLPFAVRAIPLSLVFDEWDTLARCMTETIDRRRAEARTAAAGAHGGPRP